MIRVHVIIFRPLSGQGSDEGLRQIKKYVSVGRQHI